MLKDQTGVEGNSGRRKLDSEKRGLTSRENRVSSFDRMEMMNSFSDLNKSSEVVSAPVDISEQPIIRPRSSSNPVTTESRITVNPTSNVKPVSLSLQQESDSHHSRGYLYRKDGDFENAIIEYTKAIELNPMNFKAWFNRGFAYDKLGQCNRAVSDYGYALAIDPKNAFAYYNRG